MSNFKLVKTAAALALGASVVTSAVATTDASAASKYKIKSGKLVYAKSGKVVKGYVTYKSTVYKNGKKLTGLKGKTYYKAGKKATGTYKGAYYVKGVKKVTTGTYNKAYYVKGVKKVTTGIYNKKYYKYGKVATGTYKGAYYVKGIKKVTTGTYNGAYYVKGKKVVSTGLYADKLYVDGKLNKGYKLYKEDLYKDAVLNTELALFEGKLYDGAKLNEGHKIFKDELYNGSELNTKLALFEGKLYNGAKLNEGIQKFEDKWYNNAELADGTFTIDGKEVAIENGVEVGAKVKSVEAINAKTIQVTFNKAIKESSIAGATIATDISNATINKKLSEDGRTLTLTLGTAYLTSTAQDVKVTIKDLLDRANNKVEDYAKVVSLKDDVRPALDDVAFADSKTLKVPVSEPLNATTTNIFNALTITDANGSPVDASGLSASSVSYDETDGYFTINLADLTTPLAAGTYTLKFTGLKDFAGNLINPNPTTKTITVSADETAPTVASIANVGYVGTNGYLKVNFSEPVQSLVGAKVTLNNGSAVTLVSGDIVSTSQDKKSAVIKLASTTSYQSVVIEDFKDLAGNTGKKYTGSVKFAASTPTVASYDYSASKETQTVTFDRPVSFVSGTSLTLSGTKVYDNVESTVSNVNATINDEGQLVLNTTGLTSGKYTLALPLDTVQDVAGQKNKATELTFTLDKSGVASQVEFANFTTDAAGTTPVLTSATPVQAGGIVYVKFDSPVGASAVDVNNYTIEGVNVFSNAVFTNTTKNVVKLTLKEDTIAKDTNYTFAITNVKDANDKAVKAYSGAYLFKDNTTPTFTALTVKDNTHVVATFSENLAAAVADDFVVTVNGAVVTATVTLGSGADENKVTIELPAALAQNAEVKVTIADDADLADKSTAANKAKAGQTKSVVFK